MIVHSKFVINCKLITLFYICSKCSFQLSYQHRNTQMCLLSAKAFYIHSCNNPKQIVLTMLLVLWFLFRRCLFLQGQLLLGHEWRTDSRDCHSQIHCSGLAQLSCFSLHLHSAKTSKPKGMQLLLDRIVSVSEEQLAHPDLYCFGNQWVDQRPEISLMCAQSWAAALMLLPSFHWRIDRNSINRHILRGLELTCSCQLHAIKSRLLIHW